MDTILRGKNTHTRSNPRHEIIFIYWDEVKEQHSCYGWGRVAPCFAFYEPKKDGRVSRPKPFCNKGFCHFPSIWATGLLVQVCTAEKLNSHYKKHEYIIYVYVQMYSVRIHCITHIHVCTQQFWDESGYLYVGVKFVNLYYQSQIKSKSNLVMFRVLLLLYI